MVESYAPNLWRSSFGTSLAFRHTTVGMLLFFVQSIHTNVSLLVLSLFVPVSEVLIRDSGARSASWRTDNSIILLPTFSSCLCVHSRYPAWSVSCRPRYWPRDSVISSWSSSYGFRSSPNLHGGVPLLLVFCADSTLFTSGSVRGSSSLCPFAHCGAFVLAQLPVVIKCAGTTDGSQVFTLQYRLCFVVHFRGLVVLRRCLVGLTFGTLLSNVVPGRGRSYVVPDTTSVFVFRPYVSSSLLARRKLRGPI